MVSVIAAAALAVACKSEDGGNGAAGTGGAPSGGAGGVGGVGAAGTGAGAGAAGTSSTAGTGGMGGNAGTAAGTGGGSGAGGMSGGAGGTGGMASAGTGGMGGGGGAGGMGSGGALTLTSSVVQNGAMIPAEHRCEGPSPPLAWTGGPTAMSYAILFKDTTAGGFSEGYVHWIIYDIGASTMSLPEMVAAGYAPTAPAGAHQGPIWNDVVGYNGPCAPFGMNTYKFTLYALDVAMLSELTMDSTAEEIEAQLEAHKIETATLDIKSMP
jgi:Raf kinase inhibitor-like YbhB/YbcL family protein